MISKIIRFIITVKYLKFEQIFFLVLRRILKLRASAEHRQWKFKNNIDKTRKSLPDYYKDGKTYKAFHMEFLNKSYSVKDIWFKPQDYTKLEQFNSHYLNFLDYSFNDIGLVGVMDCLEQWFKAKLVIPNDCVDHPYVQSIRVVNLIKFCLRNAVYPDQIVQCIEKDLSSIAKNQERDLQGNHLLENLKALYIGSVFFTHKYNRYSEKKCFENYLIEASQQFLADGSHEEQSPMYHSILLVGMIETAHFRRKYDERSDSTSDLRRLNLIICRAWTWLTQMSHGDGKISFFNDSTFGIAPPLHEVRTLIEREGATNPELISNETVFLKESGFFVGNTSDYKFISKFSGVGCPHQPGHAHADTFSFELSRAETRIFVNSGISTYEVCNLREFQRSSHAHNTLTVGKRSSSDVYGSFRVAKRAKLSKVCFSVDGDNHFIKGTHDGFSTLQQKILHNRTVFWNDAGCIIDDEVLGGLPKDYFIRIFLHPNIKIVKTSENKYTLFSGDEKILHLNISDASSCIVKSHYYEGFGIENISKCLVLSPNFKKTKVEMSWAT